LLSAAYWGRGMEGKREAFKGAYGSPGCGPREYKFGPEACTTFQGTMGSGTVPYPNTIVKEVELEKTVFPPNQTQRAQNPTSGGNFQWQDP